MIRSFPRWSFKFITLPEKSSNISDEIGFGFSFIAILFSGTSSFVCDIDEKILKQKEKIKNFKIFWFVYIKNNNLTHEK